MAKANKNAGWAHNPKPPSGIPARGKGHGGEAKGKPPQPKFTAEAQPSGDAKSAGHHVAREVRERIASRRFELVDRLMENALHGEAAASNQAGIYLINQIAGMPGASLDLTSAGKSLGYVIPAPPEIEDADDWANQHKRP